MLGCGTRRSQETPARVSAPAIVKPRARAAGTLRPCRKNTTRMGGQTLAFLAGPGAPGAGGASGADDQDEAPVPGFDAVSGVEADQGDGDRAQEEAQAPADGVVDVAPR